MSDVEDRKEAERVWSSDANKVLNHLHNGGWSPWTTMSRPAMTLDSINLQRLDNAVSGNLGGFPEMDVRQGLYGRAADAVSAGQPVPEEWVQRYGSPWAGVQK